MFDEYLTENKRKMIGETIEAAPNLMLEQLAERVGVPEGAIAVCLTGGECAVAPAEAFEEIWSDMCQWEKVTFIAKTPGAIVEVKCRLPEGKYGHGFFNIGGPENPLGGHLMIDRLKAVCFISRPFMGLESHGVRFYNDRAEMMFAAYVGRNGKSLIPSVLEGFMNLRRKTAKEVTS